MTFDAMFLYVSSMVLGFSAIVMAWLSKSKFQTVWFLRRAEFVFAVAILACAFLPEPGLLWAFAVAMLVLTALVLATKESDYRTYLENISRPISTEKEE